jgi:hypothetical protein
MAYAVAKSYDGPLLFNGARVRHDFRLTDIRPAVP